MWLDTSIHNQFCTESLRQQHGSLGVAWWLCKAALRLGCCLDIETHRLGRVIESLNMITLNTQRGRRVAGVAGATGPSHV
jgi:hypothetical protein